MGSEAYKDEGIYVEEQEARANKESGAKKDGSSILPPAFNSESK
jgi:hypothetical protein